MLYDDDATVPVWKARFHIQGVNIDWMGEKMGLSEYEEGKVGRRKKIRRSKGG